MRIELPAAPTPATAWRRPDQSLTLTFGPECAVTAEAVGDRPALLPLWHVHLAEVAQRGLVLTLGATTPR